MSNLRNDDAAANVFPDREIEVFRRQFEALWQSASPDGTLPQIDNFLERVPEADRAALRGELERIESIYRAERSVISVEPVSASAERRPESTSTSRDVTLPITIAQAPEASDGVTPQRDARTIDDTQQIRPGGEPSSAVSASSALTLDSPSGRSLATDENDFSLGPAKDGP